MSQLSHSQQLSLLSLYHNEIVRRLEPLYYDSEHGGGLSKLLPVDAMENMRDECMTADSFSQKLWSQLVASPMNNVLYSAILNYLQKVCGDDLHSVLSMVSERDRRSRFGFVLRYADDFIKYLDASKSLEYLKSIPHYHKIVDLIEETCKEVDEDMKKRIILRTIPLFGEYAVFDVMRTIHGTSDGATQFVDGLCPNFLRNYNLLDKERDSKRGVVNLWDVDAPIDKFLFPGKDSSETPFIPKKVDLNWEGLPHSNGIESRLLETLDICKEVPIVLRDYQKELCGPALEGNNCIVAAPTGSGKTVVAAQIIKHHLESRRNSQSHDSIKYAKVLFLIDKTMIIDQQANRLAKYLEHRYQVARTCGADNQPLHELIASKDVIVCTPQLIVNLLRETIDNSAMDVGRKPFTLHEFSMIVFDECHNTRKNSSYSVIMQHYHRDKMTGKKYAGRTLPQIVGLTASLGVGKNTKNSDDALKHMVGLCALLDSRVISVVRHHVNQLHEFSPVTADELRSCSDNSDRLRVRFSDKLEELMVLVEAEMFKKLEQTSVHVEKARGRTSPDSDLVDIDAKMKYQYSGITTAPANKSSSEYRNWVSCHIGRIIPESNLPESYKRHVMELLELLKELHLALELHEDFTSNEALTHIREQIKQRKLRGAISTSTLTIWEKYEVILEVLVSDHNEMVKETAKQLLIQRNECADFRAIVFIRTRRGAGILSKLLNEQPELSSCGIISETVFGLNKGSDEDKRTNKREQEEKLTRFSRGETRVLVATSVAEEGLDVAQCNLVIKYNYATNEIAHVQRRGRGRAENSRSILITNSQSLQEQEEANVMKERLMKAALEKIQDSRFHLELAVSAAIDELWSEITRQDSLDRETVKLQRSRGINYNLKCSKCDEFLCKHSQVKVHQESQYVVCAPEFWSRVRPQELSVDDQKDSRYAAVAKLFCRRVGCGRELGRVVRMSDCNMPVLAATGFVLEWMENGVKTKKAVKKWLNVRKDFFTPLPIQTLDLKTMQLASSAPRFLSDSSRIGQTESDERAAATRMGNSGGGTF